MPKLLLVDDEDANADMLSRRLKKKGYEVVIAATSVEACTMARTEAPSLILMDMRMVGMDGTGMDGGYEATRILKAEAKTQAIPIIGLSAYAMAEQRAKALEAGCDDYDTKPIEFVRLLEKIETLLANFGAVG